jgi:hypothetical protein
VSTSFIVECFWPDASRDRVERGATRVRETADEVSGEGSRVVFAGSIFVPGDEVVFYLFDGVSADAVQEACTRAAIRFERVVEADRST